uniref:Zn(2)-C6 fungal-type domain-containing protein n=1 Tax=Mycena chlorophos TaxID=658473 RepID=A0ABQ0LY93_MYCCL|nr:predicted protein [Mycena chlorophos]
MTHTRSRRASQPAALVANGKWSELRFQSSREINPLHPQRCDGGAPCGPCSRSRTPIACTYLPKPVGVLRTDLSKGGACLSCRRKKRKCDGTFPCITCRLSNRADSCAFDGTSPILCGSSAPGSLNSDLSIPAKAQPRSESHSRRRTHAKAAATQDWMLPSPMLPITTAPRPTLPQATRSTSSLALWNAFDFNDGSSGSGSQSSNASSPNRSPLLDPASPEHWFQFESPTQSSLYSPNGNCQTFFDNSDVYSGIVAVGPTRSPTYSADDEASRDVRLEIASAPSEWLDSRSAVAPFSLWKDGSFSVPRRSGCRGSGRIDGDLEMAAIPVSRTARVLHAARLHCSPVDEFPAPMGVPTMPQKFSAAPDPGIRLPEDVAWGSTQISRTVWL